MHSPFLDPLYGEKETPKAAVALRHSLTVLEASNVFGKKNPSSHFEFGFQMWFNGASASNVSHESSKCSSRK